MVQRQVIGDFDTYTIVSKDGSTSATFVPDRGGVCSSIVMPGGDGPRELLFQYPHLWERDSNALPGAWPFCFPVCGRLERQGLANTYYYDGKLYELPIHGFAWSKIWEVSDAGEDHLLLVLRDDEQTRAVYPFHFTVELWYEIARGRLFCRQTYTNHGNQPMPYYAGFHPYFLTPEAEQGKKQVMLNYKPVRRFRYNQHLTDLVGEQALFALPSSAANAEIHEQLTKLGEDKELHLRFANGDTLSMAAEGVEDPDLFPYLQIYSPKDQPFICLEPWMAYPNAMNSVEGARWLAPGESEHGILRLWMEGKWNG